MVVNVISASVPTGQTATCWIKYFGDYALTTNNGGSSVSILSVDDYGSLALVDGAAATTEEDVFQPVDFEISPDGAFVYVLSTNHVNSDGQPDINIFKNEGSSISFVDSVSDGIPNEDETEFGVVGMAVIY